MVDWLFWDVDTQFDFMKEEGKLYVPDAKKIIPNLEELTALARRKGIRVWGSVDHHDPDDPEISETPDFLETFPPHCLKGTTGEQKIPSTKPLNPVWIDSVPLSPEELARILRTHQGEVYFRKQRFDVFTNPNVEPALRYLNPRHIVVYGVALDVCNYFAVRGFQQMSGFELTIVVDAVKPISKERGDKLLNSWEKSGVHLKNTRQVIEVVSGTG